MLLTQNSLAEVQTAFQFVICKMASLVCIFQGAKKMEFRVC